MRNHPAKAAAGYLKHSTGRGLDSVRIAQATGALMSGALVTRAVRKRKAYEIQSSAEAKKRRRLSRQRKKEFRRPVLAKTPDSGSVAYKGKGHGI